MLAQHKSVKHYLFRPAAHKFVLTCLPYIFLPPMELQINPTESTLLAGDQKSTTVRSLSR